MKLRMFGLIVLLVFCIGIGGAYSASERVIIIKAPTNPANKMTITQIVNEVTGEVLHVDVKDTGAAGSYKAIPIEKTIIKDPDDVEHKIISVPQNEIIMTTGSPGCTWYLFGGVWYRICD